MIFRVNMLYDAILMVITFTMKNEFSFELSSLSIYIAKENRLVRVWGLATIPTDCYSLEASHPVPCTCEFAFILASILGGRYTQPNK